MTLRINDSPLAGVCDVYLYICVFICVSVYVCLPVCVCFSFLSFVLLNSINRSRWQEDHKSR